ncbi:Polygalacturonase [Nymphaea thermarum]|nr:Polygalacturonase [Nymphaea thermarum]
MGWMRGQKDDMLHVWAVLLRLIISEKTLAFQNVRDVLVTGTTSINSQLFHIVIDASQNVRVDRVEIVAPDSSPNTDGIHVEDSTGVTITNSNIGTGDDCISIGQGTQNLWIEGIKCGPGHGISIGSLGKQAVEPGVQNVTVKNVIMTGTQNGLRIKSWARKSIGFVKSVLFDGATMNNVDNPIIIDQYYCPGRINCPGQNSGVKISQVTYSNVRGTSATQVAVLFKCSPSSWCQGIRMANVQLSYRGQPSTASCQNAIGTASGLMYINIDNYGLWPGRIVTLRRSRIMHLQISIHNKGVTCERKLSAPCFGTVPNKCIIHGDRTSLHHEGNDAKNLLN